MGFEFRRLILAGGKSNGRGGGRPVRYNACGELCRNHSKNGRMGGNARFVISYGGRRVLLPCRWDLCAGRQGSSSKACQRQRLRLSGRARCIREFREEIGAEIAVGALQWVGELFFSWDGKPCHQICPYYSVTLEDRTTPRDGMFMARGRLAGKDFALEFH